MPGIRSKSICFVIPNYVTFTTGGAELQVYYLTKEFLKRGWQVELLYGRKKEQKIKKTSPYFDERITYLTYRKYKFRAFEFLSALWNLFNTKSGYYYQRTDFALTGACALHCKFYNRHMTYALAQDQDAQRKKYISELRTFSYRSRLKRLIRKVDFSLVDKLIEFGKQSANLVVCQNYEQQQLLRQNFNISSIIIPSIALQPQNNQKKENIVLWVGNMHPVKQPQLFLELADRFSNHQEWRFVMIGRIDNDIQGLESTRVEVLGECSYEETANWFARAKVFINTSEKEGMPNTFLQSWYNKVLVLSLNLNPDGVFADNRNGFVFDGNLQKLSEHLSSIINTAKIDEEVLDRSYDYVKSKHDPDEVVGNLLKQML